MRRLKTTLAAAALVAGVVVYALVLLNDGGERKLEREKAKAVQELPPGVEEAWVFHVDERLAGTLQPRGNVIQVNSWLDETLGRTTLVSNDASYAVQCAPILGGSITFFGQGEGSIEVPVYGPLSREGRQTEPALGVHPRSIAAKRLAKALCDRIASHVQRVMTPKRR